MDTVSKHTCTCTHTHTHTHTPPFGSMAAYFCALTWYESRRKLPSGGMKERMRSDSQRLKRTQGWKLTSSSSLGFWVTGKGKQQAGIKHRVSFRKVTQMLFSLKHTHTHSVVTFSKFQPNMSFVVVLDHFFWFHPLPTTLSSQKHLISQKLNLWPRILP